MRLAALLVPLALVAAPAAADRPPNDRERAAIELALRGAGFDRWEEIELDDDGPYWDVDDARTADGRRYDVKIDPRSNRIVRRQLDH